MSGFAETPSDPPHFLGHRERLKTRFRDQGGDSVADYELLELILFQVVPRRDTKPIAKALLARFGTTATCRASFGMYNTLEEVDRLAAALEKARGFFA